MFSVQLVASVALVFADFRFSESVFWSRSFTGFGLLITVLTLVSVRHRAAKKRGVKTISAGDILGCLYFLACVAFLAFFLFVPFRYGHSSVDMMKDWLNHLPPPTTDPVFDCIVYAVIVLTGLCLIPGIIATGLYLCGALLAVGFVSAVVVEPLIKLARVSATGAIVVSIIGSLPVIWLIRKNRVALGRAFWRVAEPAYGVFFDWWLTPLLQRRKETQVVEKVELKRRQFEKSMMEFRANVPEIADISINQAPGLWLEHVVERFVQKQNEKTFEAQTKTLTRIKEHFTEYRAALDAEDQLKRARGDYEEKDEESEIRKLERQKRKSTLEKEIHELKKEPEPPPSPPKGTPQKRKVAELSQLKKEWRQELAKCKGDADRESAVNRIYQDAEMKLMEGR